MANRVERTIHTLREMGVRFVIDDFGAGYSSLAYRKRLPMDKPKIDRSFIQGVGKDESSDAIVAAIASMGPRSRGRRRGRAVARHRGVFTRMRLYVLPGFFVRQAPAFGGLCGESVSKMDTLVHSARYGRLLSLLRLGGHRGRNSHEVIERWCISVRVLRLFVPPS